MKRRKRSVTVEDISMVPRVSVGSVKTRYEDGEECPAVNVKPPPLFYRMPVELQALPQESINAAFEDVAREWWESVAPHLATRCLKSAFKVHPETRQVGRSGGHLVVCGLRPVTEWNARQLAAWHRFEKAIKKSMLDAEKHMHDLLKDEVA